MKGLKTPVYCEITSLGSKAKSRWDTSINNKEKQTPNKAKMIKVVISAYWVKIITISNILW